MSEQRQKALKHTKFVDPTIPGGAKQNKLDALCELTSKINNDNGFDVPAPDYDIDTLQGEIGTDEHYNNNLEDEGLDADHPAGSLSPDQLKKVVPKELQNLNRDIRFMQKRGLDPPKRPEFISKHHEIKSKGMKHQEEKEKNESELVMKLKSRSDHINQHEEEVKKEEEKPEFMKIQLRKSSGT